MAEFVRISRNLHRMCNSFSGCTGCPLNGTSCTVSTEDLEILAHIESAVEEWAFENPEYRYPTWEEWGNTFRERFGGNGGCCPENFWHNNSNCARMTCDSCRKQEIPAEIAQKLNIEPVPITPATEAEKENYTIKRKAELLDKLLDTIAGNLASYYENKADAADFRETIETVYEDFQNTLITLAAKE